MKKILFISVFFATSFTSFSQVGIGTTNPHGSAALEVKSTNKGFLPPRVANTAAVSSPVAAGLLIYNISEKCLNLYTGTGWTNLCGAALPPTVDMDIGSGNTLTFLRHNLGADNTLDADTPVEAIHGNYYQWGRINAVADTVGIIGTWDTTGAANGAWSDTSKTVNDPCPTGYRVPTSAQWGLVIANNTAGTIGTFSNNVTNFSAAKIFTTGGGNQLTLPASGFHRGSDGVFNLRGDSGFYWSSTEDGTSAANVLEFAPSITDNASAVYGRPNGFSVRCVSE